MYVIKCHGNGKFDGCYVARSGSQSSYTKRLEDAKTFPTREAALADKCGNESVHSVSELLGSS